MCGPGMEPSLTAGATSRACEPRSRTEVKPELRMAAREGTRRAPARAGGVKVMEVRSRALLPTRWV